LQDGVIVRRLPGQSHERIQQLAHETNAIDETSRGRVRHGSPAGALDAL
jgi:hypothetical protein